MSPGDSEVNALPGSRVDSCKAKEVDQLMPPYSPRIGYRYAVPLSFIRGTNDQALRVRCRHFERAVPAGAGQSRVPAVHRFLGGS
jgi:hypothetical protein